MEGYPVYRRNSKVVCLTRGFDFKRETPFEPEYNIYFFLPQAAPLELN